jgi:peroxiredoxin
MHRIWFALLCLVSVSLLAAEPVAIGGRLDTLSLQDGDGRTVTLSAASAQPTVLVFYSTVCPISNDYNDRINALHRTYSAKGVRVLLINANSNESLADIEQHHKAAELLLPVYKDRSNVLADRLGASVTPEAFLLDRDGTLRYQGHIDDSRNPARTRVRGLTTALDELLAGKPVTKSQSKAFGCTIKRVRKDS